MLSRLSRPPAATLRLSAADQTAAVRPWPADRPRRPYHNTPAPGPDPDTRHRTGYRTGSVPTTRFGKTGTANRIRKTGYRKPEPGTGNRIPQTGCRVPNAGYQMPKTGYREPDTRNRISERTQTGSGAEPKPDGPDSGSERTSTRSKAEPPNRPDLDRDESRTPARTRTRSALHRQQDSNRTTPDQHFRNISIRIVSNRVQMLQSKGSFNVPKETTLKFAITESMLSRTF